MDYQSPALLLRVTESKIRAETVDVFLGADKGGLGPRSVSSAIVEFRASSTFKNWPTLMLSGSFSILATRA